MHGPGDITTRSEIVASFLKGLANPHRLRILCALIEGERSVSALIEATGIAPTSMSQHLARLKDESIVTCRREHRTLYYAIAPGPVRDIMQILYGHFCKDAAG